MPALCKGNLWGEWLIAGGCGLAVMLVRFRSGRLRCKGRAHEGSVGPAAAAAAFAAARPGFPRDDPASCASGSSSPSEASAFTCHMSQTSMTFTSSKTVLGHALPARACTMQPGEFLRRASRSSLTCDKPHTGTQERSEQ